MPVRVYVIAAAAVSIAALTGCTAAGQSSAAAPADRPSGSSSSAAPVEASTGGPASAGPRIGGVSGGARVTITGTGLASVQQVRFGAAAVKPATRSATRLTVVAPPAKDFKPMKVALTLVRASGTARAGTFTYRVRSGIDKQLNYALTYWKQYNPKYETLTDNDCVNFVSQTLIQRGWQQQGAWTLAGNVVESGVAWRSSTALRDFLSERPELATELTDDQRSKVRVGDIVQFDWDRSGDRDHTGVVTRIVRAASGIKIYFAGHTKNSAYRSVDIAITKEHPGGVPYYWSLR